MKLVSTSGQAAAASFGEALFRGLAPDGGLFMPERLSPLSAGEIDGLRGAGAIRCGLAVARHLLGDELEDEVLESAVREALGFPLPLVPLGPRTHVLELFHGPTLAFKDVGARFMGCLMSRLRRSGPPLTVMVATSGDTGGAVAHAFLGLPRTRVVVLFPEGQVSEHQQRQFTTLGDQVLAVAMAGAFDDCQRLVKAMFRDPDAREALALTSANSINIGRLLPQIFYYFHAWAQLNRYGPLVFSVPSGNFGNLAAGLMARELGLPAGGFVTATNANDVVPEYLRTGCYEPRASVRTLSSAMDVGSPSNLARILALFDGDLARLRRHLSGSAWSDADTRKAMRRVFDEHGYILDPHTAVGWLALEQALAERPDAHGVVLATAHPGKFGDIVEEAIGRPVPVPEQLAAGETKPSRFTRIPPSLGELQRVVMNWAGR
ncbi:MAG: threonine synthase [Gammaproteobacteria bacterium]|nr:threonine synthase [Gammaproteobacteria bacterium]